MRVGVDPYLSSRIGKVVLQGNGCAIVAHASADDALILFAKNIKIIQSRRY